MPRPRKSIPSYLCHAQSGRARAVWTDPAGIRRYKLLPGAFNSPEPRAAFATLLLEQQVDPHQQPAHVLSERITLLDLLLAFLDHAERHYRTPGGNRLGPEQNQQARPGRQRDGKLGGQRAPFVPYLQFLTGISGVHPSLLAKTALSLLTPGPPAVVGRELTPGIDIGPVVRHEGRLWTLLLFAKLARALAPSL